jgi:hypothetical protein
MSHKLDRVLSRFVKRVRDERVYGRLGRINADGTVTVVVETRPDHVYITMDGGTLETLPNKGRGRVPERRGLPVQMIRHYNGELVLDGADDTLLENDAGSGDNPYNVPAHPIGTHTDVVLTSETAGDVFKYDGTDWVNSNSIPETVAATIDAAADLDPPTDATKFGVVLAGVLWSVNWDAMKNTLVSLFDTLYDAIGSAAVVAANLVSHAALTTTHGVTGNIVGTGGAQTLTDKTLTAPTIADFTNAAHDHGDADDGGAIVGYIKADGTVVLTAEWDIGEDMAIRAERFEARDVEGLRLEDDGGNPGIVIIDGGNVGAGGTPNAAYQLHVPRTSGGSNIVAETTDTAANAQVVAIGNGGNCFFMMHGTTEATNRWGFGAGNLADFAEVGSFNASGMVIGNIGNVPLYFGTNNVARGVVTGAGLFGFGTDVPSGKLSVQAGTSADHANVGGVLASNITTVGNVGTGADNLMTFAIPANTLAVNGQSIWFEAIGIFTNSANAKTMTINFGATVLGTFATGGGTALQLFFRGRIWRTGAATQRAWCEVQNTVNLTPFGFYTTPAETLSGAITIKGVGTATSNSEVTMVAFKVGYDDVNS